jgi:hypothetical protein
MGQTLTVTTPGQGPGRPRQASPPPAGHLVRNGLLAAPLLVATALWWRGSDGGWSAAFGLTLATLNLLVAARSLEWAAGVSLTAVGAVALGGYVVRLAVITVVVLGVRHLPWVDLPALGISLVVAHLGLLVWEARSIHQAAEATVSLGTASGRE